MATKTPIILDATKHTPLASGDKLPGTAVQLSADASNTLSLGSDDGLFAPPSSIGARTASVTSNGLGIIAMDKAAWYSVGNIALNGDVVAADDFTFAGSVWHSFMLKQTGNYLLTLAAAGALKSPTSLVAGQQYWLALMRGGAGGFSMVSSLILNVPITAGEVGMCGQAMTRVALASSDVLALGVFSSVDQSGGAKWKECDTIDFYIPGFDSAGNPKSKGGLTSCYLSAAFASL
jgi:hypothetical protein